MRVRPKYERLFDKLVGCSGEYTVSENEKQNVAFRGIPVTLVSKFCMELSENHSAPTTSKEVNSTEDPVGNGSLQSHTSSDPVITNYTKKND